MWIWSDALIGLSAPSLAPTNLHPPYEKKPPKNLNGIKNEKMFGTTDSGPEQSISVVKTRLFLKWHFWPKNRVREKKR